MRILMTLTMMMMMMMSLNGMTRDWTAVDSIVDKGHESRLFGEGSLYVGSPTEALHDYSIGRMNKSQVFDIASLTKVVATATSIMILNERGLLSLSDKVSKYFPEFKYSPKESVSVEDLLRHRSGLPAGASPLEAETYLSYIARITKNPLHYRPRTQMVYSDLSFILLGRIVELVSGGSLASFATENIFGRLKMQQTSYSFRGNTLNCVPTSEQGNCLVHDPTANKLLPASTGNAGVFSNVSDLVRYCRMLLGDGELDGVRILSEKSIRIMTTSDGLRGLGWDFTSEYSTAPRGEIFPPGISFGHTGYTGTTIWIDPKSQSFYVFLSNRIYMGDERTRKAFTQFRKTLSTAIGSVIYGPSHF